MAIVGLDKVINGNLLTRLSRVTQSAGSNSAIPTSSSGAGLQGQALYDTLRVGARNFAAGLQLLNSAVSFVNVSLDINQRLLDIVDEAAALTDIANRGNITGSAAARYRRDIEAMAKKFDELIDSSVDGSRDLLDVKDLQEVFERSGLFPDKTREVKTVLSEITSPTDTAVNGEGEVVTDGNPIPVESFRRALRSAVIDPDMAEGDNSGFFRKIRSSLDTVRARIRDNVEALEAASKFVKDNMTLVRAAGLAFLELSDSITGTETAEQIAEDLQSRIRSSAPTALPQARYLETIMIAGLAALGEASATK